MTRGRVPHSVCPEVVRVKSAKRLSRLIMKMCGRIPLFSTSPHPEYVNIEKFSSGPFRLQWIHLCARENSTGKHTNSVQSEKAVSRSNGVGMAVPKVKYGFEIVCLRLKSWFGQNLIVSDVTECPWWLFQRELSSIIFFEVMTFKLSPKKSDSEEGICVSLHLLPLLACLHRLNKNISRSAVHTQKSSKNSLVFKSTNFIASHVHLPRLQRTHHEGKV